MVNTLKVFTVFVLMLSTTAVFAENEVLKRVGDKYYLFQIPTEKTWQIDSVCGKVCLKKEEKSEVCAIDSFRLEVKADLAKFKTDTLMAVLAFRISSSLNAKDDGDMVLLYSLKDGYKAADKNYFFPKVADKFSCLFGRRENSSLSFFPKESLGEFKIFWWVLIPIFFLLLAVFLTVKAIKMEDSDFVVAVAVAAVAVAVAVAAAAVAVAVVAAAAAAAVVAELNKIVAIVLLFVSESLIIASLLISFGWRFGVVMITFAIAALLTGLFIKKNKPVESAEVEIKTE